MPRASAPLLLVAGIVGMAARARRRPVVSGTAQRGTTGEVIEFAGGEGWALVDGERWKVRAATGLQPGQRVRITRVDGLVLDVRPEADANAPPGDSP